MISKRSVINFIKKNKSNFEKIHMSFFELTVAMAFNYFSEESVDIAVIECGLGGRLDSTNIILPEEIYEVVDEGLEVVGVLENILIDYLLNFGASPIWSYGPMDKARVYGTRDSRFESW